MEYRYITLFDIEGFESILDISDDDNAKAETILNDENIENLEKSINSLVVAMLFRARANAHRYPEVWVFWSEIDQKTLMNAAEENPQMMANLIRERGECLHKTVKPKSVIL